MIFSCTQKARKKLVAHKAFTNDIAIPSLYNWYVHLIILERKQYFLFTNAKTLFSCFIYVGNKEIKSTIEIQFEGAIKRLLKSECKLEEKIINKYFEHKPQAIFCKTSERSILTSMNDIKYRITAHLEDRKPLSKSHHYIEHLINRVPSGKFDYKYPFEMMKAALEKEY